VRQQIVRILFVVLPVFLQVSCVMARVHQPAPEIEREQFTDAQMLEMLAQKPVKDDPYAGVATYYASRFTGRRTTSGQRYHPDKLTAAHADLPLGSMVTVENVATSQKVAVVINDRCRRRSFQLIDLSRAAAKKIGLWGKGVVKVRIVPLVKKHLLSELLEDGEGA
jgi:rare lipoprotein A